MAVLRVLHVTPYGEHAWAYGGIPRVVAAQTRALASRGVRVTVATTDACGAGRLPQDKAGQSGDGVDTVVFPNLSNRLARNRQLFLPLGLGRYLAQRAGTFHVAHLHACHNLPGAIASRHLVRAGVPYVVQPNGTAPRIERRRLAKLFFDLTVGRRTLRDAARVVAVTAAEQRQLENLGVASSRVVLIPNPVDLKEFDSPCARGGFREAHGLGSAPLVVYLGQLGPRKRVNLAVRAFAQLACSSARLVIAGADMGCETALRRLTGELRVADHTLFPGCLEGEQRLAALADADVVVYPSEHEIFGLVPVEALLCGTPVLVCGDSGCGEVIAGTGGGLVLDEPTPAALARAIRQLLADPGQWRGRAAAAAQRVRQRYGGQVVAAKLEVLYRELAGEETP